MRDYYASKGTTLDEAPVNLAGALVLRGDLVLLNSMTHPV